MKRSITTGGTRSSSTDLDLRQPHRTAVEQGRAALHEQGFGVLTAIDLEATVKEKVTSIAHETKHRPEKARATLRSFNGSTRGAV